MIYKVQVIGLVTVQEALEFKFMNQIILTGQKARQLGKCSKCKVYNKCKKLNNPNDNHKNPNRSKMNEK